MAANRTTSHASRSAFVAGLRCMCLPLALAVPVLWQVVVVDGGLLRAHEVLRTESVVSPDMLQACEEADPVHPGDVGIVEDDLPPTGTSR
jgi:hypothetical protein